jgi:hypothetical protein
MSWRFCFLLAALDLCLWACTSTPIPHAGFIGPTIQPADIILESYSPSFDDIAMMAWGTEAVERFGPGVVIVGAHGWYAVKGDWLVFPTTLNSTDTPDRPWPVETLIAYEEAAHPTGMIVLLCCNSDHVTLHGHPRVWYSHTDNFITPTRFTSPAEQIKRRLGYPDIVGDIDQFINAG